jgi:ferric-dicitrate binding protein FerR (iron transport regulator)
MLSKAFVVTGNGRIRQRVIKKIIVASVLLCAMIASWLVFIRPAYSLLPDKTAASITHIFKTKAGQRQTVRLPDGTEVILNANSEVSVAADFNDTKREVWLTGNAFFKVAKNAKKTFMVHAANVTTIAVGTEFYVHNPGSGESVQVELLEGKVRLKDSRPATTKEMTLVPGETGKSTATAFVKETFDAAYLRRWVAGRITFNETPVLHAIRQLETWFGTKIEIKKTGLKNRLISGEYQDKTLQEILGMICFSTGCNYSEGPGSVITIK